MQVVHYNHTIRAIDDHNIMKSILILLYKLVGEGLLGTAEPLHTHIRVMNLPAV